MKEEKNTVELITEPNILKKVELCGRICYNSQNRITDDSYIKFINSICKSGHTSVLEHSNVIIKYYVTSDEDDIIFVYEWLLARKGLTNSHVLITLEHGDDNIFIMISGNIRSWQDFLNFNISNKELYDGDDHILNLYSALSDEYPIVFPPIENKPWSEYKMQLLTEAEAADINIEHTSYTFKITTSRDITHQIVRHRTLSFSQQSQRYINYSLDKNDGEITFITPRITDESNLEFWKDLCQTIENAYNGFIDDGYTPEVSRCILPNCTKSIIYVTGHYNDWQHFIMLRNDDHAQSEIHELANMIDKEIKKCYM